MIEIVVNGRPMPCRDGATLADLGQELGLVLAAVVCEHNGELCHPNGFSQIQIQPGDRIEFLHFMGGGQSSGTPNRLLV